MSDGEEDATLNCPPPPAPATGQLTASSPSAAPWERFTEPPPMTASTDGRLSRRPPQTQKARPSLPRSR